MLNGHFVNAFQKIMSAFNRPDVIATNQQSLVSSYMNDVVQFCDAKNFQNEISSILNVALTEIANTLQRGTLTSESENLINLLSGLI